MTDDINDINDSIDDETRKELNIDADTELTPELLQQKLREYHEAFNQEFIEKAEKATDGDDIKSLTQDFFRTRVAEAAANIAWLAQNSTSDTVRLSASKFIVQSSFSEEKDSGDPIKQLLKELAGESGSSIKSKQGKPDLKPEDVFNGD